MPGHILTGDACCAPVFQSPFPVTLHTGLGCVQPGLGWNLRPNASAAGGEFAGEYPTLKPMAYVGPRGVKWSVFSAALLGTELVPEFLHASAQEKREAHLTGVTSA
ncbi:hypothetical protein AYO21_08210 [Fonsecaea monophora]|uniref:Uncharacterized protein n=1 Tax=Fonsecaea monophora TaxID=254056 RepID=A0A177F2R2_9EURO|nr:hypothetical protein AYO21_08210 [Fonsecaea monophora]OAG37602.1 hypothetical protein AYO21_08210 [Fonsecaea monophora]